MMTDDKISAQQHEPLSQAQRALILLHVIQAIIDRPAHGAMTVTDKYFEIVDLLRREEIERKQ